MEPTYQFLNWCFKQASRIDPKNPLRAQDQKFRENAVHVSPLFVSFLWWLLSERIKTYW